MIMHMHIHSHIHMHMHMRMHWRKTLDLCELTPSRLKAQEVPPQGPGCHTE